MTKLRSKSSTLESLKIIECDIFGVKKWSELVTLVKSAHRKSVNKYHTDKPENGTDETMIRLVNNAKEYLDFVMKEPNWYYFDRKENRADNSYLNTLQNSIDKIINISGIAIEIIGIWVWVWPAKNMNNEKDVLSAGFVYSKKRKGYYYTTFLPKYFKKGYAKTQILRDEYGSKIIKKAQLNKQIKAST